MTREEMNKFIRDFQCPVCKITQKYINKSKDELSLAISCFKCGKILFTRHTDIIDTEGGSHESVHKL